MVETEYKEVGVGERWDSSAVQVLEVGEEHVDPQGRCWDRSGWSWERKRLIAFLSARAW